MGFKPQSYSGNLDEYRSEGNENMRMAAKKKQRKDKQG